MGKDNFPQIVELSIKFRYKVDTSSPEPYMVINFSNRYNFGDRIDGYGLVDTALDERFWKYLCFLALRRYYGVNDGWVTASELNQLFDRQISPEGNAARKYFSRRLKLYIGEKEPVNTHLIEYRKEELPHGGGTRGISVGPYRLSVGPPKLKINPNDCWDYIYGFKGIINIRQEPWNTETIDDIFALFSAGKFVENRNLIIDSIGHLLIEKKEKIFSSLPIFFSNLLAPK